MRIQQTSQLIFGVSGEKRAEVRELGRSPMPPSRRETLRGRGTGHRGHNLS
jgi:hypothetical protein